MKPLFVSGTDTDVGKSVISAGLARAALRQNIDVGVMKPFAALQPGGGPDDAKVLAAAAECADSLSSITPQRFDVPASPYTASKETGKDVNLDAVMSEFARLASSHELLIIEGIGGIMTPITKKYHVADLIYDMGARVIITVRNSIGAVNHTIMTADACAKRGLDAAGLIINCMDAHGYDARILERDLPALTGIGVIAVMPKLDAPDADTAADALKETLDALVSS